MENIKETRVDKYKNRNNYIDILKCIAIISVVFIHTAFSSGENYVPRWFANFTLLFEVPMFFFLAGWSSSYSKSVKSYIKSLMYTQIRYMIYILIVSIVVNIANFLTIDKITIGMNEFIQWIFHKEIMTKPLMDVSSILWFFRVYFIVSILGAFLLNLLKEKVSKNVTIILLVIVFITTFIFTDLGKLMLGVEYSYIFFYLFFFMLGSVTKDRNLTLPEFIVFVLSIIVMLVIIKILTPINIFKMQENKFPPNFIFLLWSSFGVIIVLYLKNFFMNCKENIFSNIGKNSIYVYFAEGIAGSLLYYIYPIVDMEWYYKIIIMFGINLILTAVITIILKKVIDPISKRIKVFLEKNIYN